LEIYIYLSAVFLAISFFSIGFVGLLGPDAAIEVLRVFGWASFWSLVMSLAVQPLIRIFQLKKLFPLKRVFGLICFFFACLHSSLYLFESSVSLEILFDDLRERPHLRLGYVSLAILSLLALTSNRFSQRTLGKAWKKLHKVVYMVALVIAFHIVLSNKSIVGSDWWPLLIVIICLVVRQASIATLLNKRLLSFLRKKSF
jgi:sulfoxide reductase heme-binding subunit YedZ